MDSSHFSFEHVNLASQIKHNFKILVLLAATRSLYLNAGNAISGLQILKIFGGACPQTPLEASCPPNICKVSATAHAYFLLIAVMHLDA